MEMNDIIIDFIENRTMVKAVTEKGLKYLKSHWQKRPLFYDDRKYVKHFDIAHFKKHGIKWAVKSDPMLAKQREIDRREEENLHNHFYI